MDDAFYHSFNHLTDGRRYNVIPLYGEHFEKQSQRYRKGFDGVEILAAAPPGRFPTTNELRQLLAAASYRVKEMQHWFVLAQGVRATIWLPTRLTPDSDDAPRPLWVQSKDQTGIDILQLLTDTVGSLLLHERAGMTNILLVPDSVYGVHPLPPDELTFLDTMTRRIPISFARLHHPAPEEGPFLLSQLIQALHITNNYTTTHYYRALLPHIPHLTALLSHTNGWTRYYAFALLVALWPDLPTAVLDDLNEALLVENTLAVRYQMIAQLAPVLVYSYRRAPRNPHLHRLLDGLDQLAADHWLDPHARYLAADTVARARGTTTLIGRDLLSRALVNPGGFLSPNAFSLAIHAHVRKTIQGLPPSESRAILMAALLQIKTVEWSHAALRDLLDITFFGRVVFANRRYVILPPDMPAERPPIDRARFEAPIAAERGFIYEQSAFRRCLRDLTPTQRRVLSFAMALDTPWMLHSNLLERYGLPPTRREVRHMLQGGSPIIKIDRV